MTVFFVLFGIKVCFPLSWILNDCQTMFLFVSADPYFYWWHSFSLKQIHETNITITTSLSCNFPRKFICKLFLMLLPELLLVIMAFFLGGTNRAKAILTFLVCLGELWWLMFLRDCLLHDRHVLSDALDTFTSFSFTLLKPS